MLSVWTRGRLSDLTGAVPIISLLPSEELARAGLSVVCGFETVLHPLPSFHPSDHDQWSGMSVTVEVFLFGWADLSGFWPSPVQSLGGHPSLFRMAILPGRSKGATTGCPKGSRWGRKERAKRERHHVEMTTRWRCTPKIWAFATTSFASEALPHILSWNLFPP